MTAKLQIIDFCHVLTQLEGFNATLEILIEEKIVSLQPLLKVKK